VTEVAVDEPEATEPESDPVAPAPIQPEDFGQRLEEARRRLRKTIPPPEE
jgi:hypothetical protein